MENRMAVYAPPANAVRRWCNTVYANGKLAYTTLAVARGNHGKARSVLEAEVKDYLRNSHTIEVTA